MKKGKASRYKSNEVLRMIGKQSEPWDLYMTSETLRDEVKAIINAPDKGVIALAMDMFALGMIYGKRAERARHREPWKGGRRITMNLHCEPAPETISGVSVRKKGAGDKYLVLLNSTKSEKQRAASFLHECLHIYHQDHDREDLTTDQIEAVRHAELLEIIRLLEVETGN